MSKKPIRKRTNTFTVKFLDDDHDCHKCGTTWATGALVLLNGKVFLNLKPKAGCVDEASYTPEEVYKEIIKTLGFEIVEIEPNA